MAIEKIKPTKRVEQAKERTLKFERDIRTVGPTLAKKFEKGQRDKDIAENVRKDLMAALKAEKSPAKQRAIGRMLGQTHKRLRG